MNQFSKKVRVKKVLVILGVFLYSYNSNREPSYLVYLQTTLPKIFRPRSNDFVCNRFRNKDET